MNISSPALQQLHHVHECLAELRSQLARGPAQIRATETKLQRLEQEFAAAREAVKKCKLAAAERELQLKERENRILDIRSRLNSCSNNKEYQALIERIAADEQANSVLSDEILDFYEKLASLEKAAASLEDQRQKSQHDLAELRQRVAQDRVRLEVDIGDMEARLLQAEAVLTAEVRPHYDRMVKAHGPEALAPVRDDVCEGCYQRVTSQMINDLRMSHTVFCKSCGRLLYLPGTPPSH